MAYETIFTLHQSIRSRSHSPHHGIKEWFIFLDVSPWKLVIWLSSKPWFFTGRN
jgi:hypothetical protein